MTTLRIALDWYPNVIHSGILLAGHWGMFQSVGVHLEILTPEVDGYTRKPIQRLLDGEVECAIAPSEHMMVYGGWGSAVSRVEPLASIMQRDCSAFVTTRVNDVTRPRDLDGLTYAAYSTPGELELLKAMIRADGGRGDVRVISPPRFEVWQALMNGEADIAWVFLPWEGVLAERENTSLRAFTLGDYGVPYGHTSVIIGRSDSSDEQRGALGRMLSAMACGYSVVARDPLRSASLLCDISQHEAFSDRQRVTRAAERIAPCLMTGDGLWGTVDVDGLNAYRHWLTENRLLGGDT
jgi:ABC-type nitrate/sulfonate/bicarbonate transport system substrate-binding protein